MYWCGMRPGDLHMAIGAPGWAGHTFTAFFAPWNAGASILMMNQPRFNAREILDTLVAHKVDSLFAPPTVWRFLLQEDLASWPVTLKTASAAGEPLNPEVIERVRAAWHIDVKDGWGQSEATVQIANTIGQPLHVGALGRPLPGCAVTILDENGNEADEGELSLPMHPRPIGLMLGYLQDDGSVQGIAGNYYRSGRGKAQRRRHLYIYRAGRRCVQIVRLPHQPVRA
jgi:acetyl-CoA synthetase